MKLKHILIILVVAVALGVIISTFTNTSTYADFAQARKKPGRELHIIGTLDTTEPVIYDTRVDANVFSFYMIDNKGEKRKVIHKNNKPQDFEKSEQVVVIGSMQGDTFLANSLLLKCPSKYNDDKKPTGFGEQEFTSGSK
ncbi:MAG TPA: cytochrome c maturation protein CcmE [Bacteroidales bacterium]|nr:cytochrome c maturation protein CcmE [Bacteroidales bacterium]HSA43945.1 cytochrome c maturation protein CcmE [Bacteroidales bacterium]